MIKKLSVVLVLTLLCIGCGAEKEQVETTEIISEAYQSETLEPQIAITGICINRNTKAVCMEAEITTPEHIDAYDYTPNEMSVARVEMETEDGMYHFKWYGFYQKEENFSYITMKYQFEDVEDECVSMCAQVEEIPDRSFEVEIDGHIIPVDITPFSVTIEPKEEWLDSDMDCHYDMYAMDTEQKMYYVTHFTNVSNKKEASLGHINVDEVPELGDGWQSAVAQEYQGIRYVMRTEIDIESIDHFMLVPTKD